MKKERIMIVEDDNVTAEHLRTSLMEWGYRVDPVVPDGVSAIREASRQKPDLVLMDIRLKGPMDGITAAEVLSGQGKVPIVFLNAPEDRPMVEKRGFGELALCLEKPVDDRLLKLTVESAFYRHKMEAALKESERRYRAIIEQMSEGYYEVDLKGNFTFLNKAMAQMVGIPKGQLLQMNNRDFMEPETAALVYKKYNEVYRTGIPVRRFDHELKTKAGRRRYLEASINLIKDKEGHPVGFGGVVRDVTEKRKMEVSLIKTRSFLQNILNQSLDGISTTDMRGRIVYATPRLEEMIGYTQKELIGKRVHTFYKNGKKDAKFIMEVLTEKGDLKNHEMQFVSKSGGVLDIMLSASMLKDESGNPIGTVGIFKDVTEKKRMEEQILQSQKLESIAVLAGGIAHDFNNILTAVVGNISLARMYVKAEGKLAHILTEAERACDRARALTTRLLSFTKGEKSVKRVDAIGQLIQDVTQIVLSGSNIIHEFDIPPDLWRVEFNAEEMKQALTNIVLNAMESMPRGGVVRVTGRNVVFNREHGEIPEGVLPGKYVQISFIDQGMGISPEHLPKIFDPYFSTKERGREKGMGLGLTTVYSIVKRHEGYIHVTSKEGAGTAVHLFLPAQESVPEKARGTAAPDRARERPKGKILVMDDEAIVREVVGEMLKEMGYSVKFAKEGSEAIELYQKAKNARTPFEAVILDLTVKAGMGGRDTLNRLLEIDPHVKAFVSSGYREGSVMRDPQKHGFIGAIPKPFTMETLKEEMERNL